MADELTAGALKVISDAQSSGATRRARFLTIGEPLIAITPSTSVPFEHAELLRTSVGGAELNTAIAVARLGLQATFVGNVGSDGPGRQVLRSIDSEGIDRSHVAIVDGRPTGIYLREWCPDGSRRVLYYRRQSPTVKLSFRSVEPLRGAISDSDVILLTGITLALGDGPRAACHALKALALQAGASVFVDPNIRPSLWSSRNSARKEIDTLTKGVTGVLASSEDLEWLYGSSDTESSWTRIRSLDVEMMVIKRGEHGAELVDGSGDRYSVAPSRTNAVLDPVGAGDGFNGGLIAGLLKGLGRRAAMLLGAWVGARAVESSGDSDGFPKIETLPPDVLKVVGWPDSPR